MFYGESILSDGVNKEQTARFVQSDLDLHCPRKDLKVPLSSPKIKM